MKKILVLTDFSANAAHAAANAVYLAEKMQAGLLLYYTYHMAPVTPYYTGGPYVPEAVSVFEEESNKELKELSEKLKKQMEGINDEYRPSVLIQTGEGDLGENVKDLLKQKDIELIVMGSRTGSFFDHLLSGSETQAIIDHANKPVIIIPPDSEIKHLKKVVFATNYQKNDIQALNYLVVLAQVVGFKIEVVHINMKEQKSFGYIMDEIEFKRHISGLKQFGLTYHDIRGNDVVSHLNHFCSECGADMLAMVHYHHNIFKKIFGANETKNEICHQKQALLVFPPNFTKSEN
jgi:nucleotide-binding universal stress UspA family protein/ribosomal protein S27AE